MTVVSEIIIDNIPANRKATPSGWISFNAPCCVYNGTSADTRQRGGVLERDDVISYHCFNCGFKTSWQPGRTVSYKLKQLLYWLGVPDDQVNKLALAVLRINEGIEVKERFLEVPKFVATALPDDAILINNYTGHVNSDLEQVLEYMQKRNLFLEDSDFYWIPTNAYKKRLVIPFKYNNEIVGWTARHIGGSSPKYLTDSQPGYVFNLDKQTPDRDILILNEGPMDAIPIQAAAILGSEISPQQAMLINKLKKQVAVVPDRDAAGSKLVEASIEHGWGVSMPDWGSGIKDTGDAINKYGRLYTLYSIISSLETSPLKIRLRAKKWYAK